MPSCNSPRPETTIGVGAGRVLDAQRHIALGLLEQAGADHAARDLVALGAGERRIIDEEGHGQGRRIDRLRLQRLVHIERAKRVGDVEFFKTSDGHDIAGLRLLDRLALDAAKRQDLGDAAVFDHLALAVEHLDLLVGLHAAGENPTGDDAAEIGIGLEQRAEQAETAFFDLGLRHMLDHEIEQRRHAILRAGRLVGHPALLGGAVDDREVELLVGGVERREKIEHLVHHLGDAGVRLVDLIDADDGLEADLERLADHEFGLRHGALGGVDQHDGAVDHGQNALHLAAEIRVAGRVDDIDAGVLPGDRGRLGHDRDATLFFKIVAVHDALGHALVLAERARLLEQTIDERGLAVIDVGDDGDVAQLHG